jgi:hypothetical protein
MKPVTTMRTSPVVILRLRDALGLKRFEKLYASESNGFEDSCSLDIVEGVLMVDRMKHLKTLEILSM